MQELDAGYESFHRELHRLLALLAEQRRAIARELKSQSVTIEQDETAEAQLVLAAQQRLRFGNQRG
jgi:hypothetical protein